MNSNAQNASIVSGKSQKQKRCAIFSVAAASRQYSGLLRYAKNPNWKRIPGHGRARKIRIGNLALPAPSVNALEPGSGMVACGFAKRRFLICLRVGHSLIDALENLLFRESGIFQTADFRAAHGALAP